MITRRPVSCWMQCTLGQMKKCKSTTFLWWNVFSDLKLSFKFIVLVFPGIQSHFVTLNSRCMPK